MKLPLSWLKEFLAADLNLGELAERLTVGGLEVENIERLTPTFSGVYVADVLKVERHPNADRLSLCEVDAGPAGHFSVVCGAPNVHAGMKAALAKVGARLGGGVHGEGGGALAEVAPLAAAVIRGVQSEGMLCSELELGLSKEHAGILELPADAPVGADFSTYLGSDDTVLDIAITPNRGDCLSILGLAREIAAVFRLPLKTPRIRRLKTAPATSSPAVTVALEAPDLCPRYAALPMTRVTIAPSPLWLRRRLELCGMRALNNVVDATNYVMLELGQPLHAFDMARIANRQIVVRRAGSEQSFTTLDSTERMLHPDCLLIADREKPLAVAGVMGGLDSEVSAGTTALMLESAYFEPMTIARTARRLGLRSEASYRFERGIDRAGQVRALERVAGLIGELAGGRASAPVLDVEPRPAAKRTIDCDLGALAALLGVALPPAEIRRRLVAVGARVTTAGRAQLRVTPPSFRPDLNEPADLAEEVARLDGLKEIPALLPTRPAVAAVANRGREFARVSRDILSGCGLVEAKTIAFIAPAENERFPGIEMSEPLDVTNPLSAELSQMRRSLVPGLLAALRFNLNHETAAMHVFEIGKVFGMRDGVAGEAGRVAGVSYGNYALAPIGTAPIKADFWTVKGVLETYFRALGLPDRIEYEAGAGRPAYLHPGRSASMRVEGKLLGVMGELHPAEALKVGFSDACILFELDSNNLIAYRSLSHQGITAPPRFPAVRRDLALVLDRGAPAARVLATLRAINSPLLEDVELFDVYAGESVPAGKKSVAIACRYRGKDRTLTDEEVNRAHAALVEEATMRLGAVLRQ